MCVVQATAAREGPGAQSLHTQWQTHPATVGRLHPRLDEQQRGLLLTLQIQAIAHEKPAEAPSDRCRRRNCLPPSTGLRGRTFPTHASGRPTVAQREVHERIVHPDNTAGGAHFFNGPAALDFHFLHRAPPERRGTASSNRKVPRPRWSKDPGHEWAFDDHAPIASTDVVHVTDPKILHDGVVAAHAGGTLSNIVPVRANSSRAASKRASLISR